MLDSIIKNAKEKMEKSLSNLSAELGRVRTGRASLELLDGIKVSSYGTSMPLNQVASLSIPEPRLITIQAWDASLISEIEKAILNSDLGLTPNNDGKLIRLSIPSLTEERRKDLVKQVKKYCEETRIAIRHIRREAIDEIKKTEKEKACSEDDAKKFSDEVQKITDTYIDRVDKVFAKKEKDLLEV